MIKKIIIPFAYTFWQKNECVFTFMIIEGNFLDKFN